jgi:hypothetical protein
MRVLIVDGQSKQIGQVVTQLRVIQLAGIRMGVQLIFKAMHGRYIAFVQRIEQGTGSRREFRQDGIATDGKRETENKQKSRSVSLHACVLRPWHAHCARQISQIENAMPSLECFLGASPPAKPYATYCI